MRLKHISWFIFAMTVAYVIFIYQSLPDQVAAHFDLNGNPNRYDGKSTFFVLLAIELFVLGLFELVSKMDPSSMNHPVKLTPRNKAFQIQNTLTTLRGTGVFVAFLMLSIVRYMHQKTFNPDYSMVGVHLSTIALLCFLAYRVYLSFKHK